VFLFVMLNKWAVPAGRQQGWAERKLFFVCIFHIFLILFFFVSSSSSSFSFSFLFVFVFLLSLGVGF